MSVLTEHGKFDLHQIDPLKMTKLAYALQSTDVLFFRATKSRWWQYEAESGWHNYGEKLNVELAEMGKKGTHQYVAPNGVKYELNLNHMISREIGTSNEQRIRLHEQSVNKELVNFF